MGVPAHEHRELLLVEPQQVATKDRQVAPELGPQVGEREVPSAEQHHPDAVRPLQSLSREVVQSLPRERVCVVDHEQARSVTGVQAGQGSVEVLDRQLDRGVHP